MSLKIAATSDTHGMLTLEMLPPADVLVIAGDYIPNQLRHVIGRDGIGRNEQDAKFQLIWLEEDFVPLIKQTKYRKVIVVPGNHDWAHFEPSTSSKARHLLADADITLLDEQIIHVDDVKFYGSPWTPYFHGWAFNLPENNAAAAHKRWAKMPDKIDVLITHGPPFQIMDRTLEGRVVGDPQLRDRIFEVAPKLHLFGHIHEGYGQMTQRGTLFGNVSLCTRQYMPTNPIQVFEV